MAIFHASTVDVWIQISLIPIVKTVVPTTCRHPWHVQGRAPDHSFGGAKDQEHICHHRRPMRARAPMPTPRCMTVCIWSVRYGRCACAKTSGKTVRPRHPPGCLVLNPRDPGRAVWQYVYPSQNKVESLRMHFSNSAIYRLRSTHCRRSRRAGTARGVGTKVLTSGEDAISRVRQVLHVAFRSSLFY